MFVYKLFITFEIKLCKKIKAKREIRYDLLPYSYNSITKWIQKNLHKIKIINIQEPYNKHKSNSDIESKNLGEILNKSIFGCFKCCKRQKKKPIKTKSYISSWFSYFANRKKKKLYCPPIKKLPNKTSIVKLAGFYDFPINEIQILSKKQQK